MDLVQFRQHPADAAVVDVSSSIDGRPVLGGALRDWARIIW